MIQAKYIFTISIDNDGKRHIQCELPPHDIETEKGLRALKLEMDNVYSYCLDMYNDCNKMLLELSNKQWNVQTVEALNDSNSQLIQ